MRGERSRLIGAGIVGLALLAGGGIAVALDSGSSKPTGSVTASGTVGASVPALPDLCKDPSGFAAAMQRLSREPGVYVSPAARQQLRALRRSALANCSSAAFTATLTAKTSPGAP